jgi:hypothetical protein
MAPMSEERAITTGELDRLVRPQLRGAHKPLAHLLLEKRRQIRSRYRPVPTRSMCLTLHALAAIGPEVERALRWEWPRFKSAFPFDWDACPCGCDVPMSDPDYARLHGERA